MSDDVTMSGSVTRNGLVRTEQVVKIYQDKDSVPVRALDGIDLSCESGEFTAIATIGHNLKGSGAGYGFRPISEIGARIWRAAKADDAAVVSTGADELEAYLDTVRWQPAAPTGA